MSTTPDFSDISFVFDTDVSKFSAGSINAIYETTLLSLTLHGLRASFNRILQCPSPIDFSFTDRLKELQEKRESNNLKYPYAYIVLNDLDLLKDQANTTAMSHRGLAGRKAFIGDSVDVTYAFPMKLNITLNVLDSDVVRLLSYAQSLILADVARAFNFKINAFDTQSICKVQRSGNISFPENLISTDNEQDYNSGKVSLSFEVQGWIGFTCLVPGVKTINLRFYQQEVNSDKRTLEQAYILELKEEDDGKVNLYKFLPADKQ
jgi:hypothetical protein